MNFDKVAAFYDPLARFVFGHSIFKAQTAHFNTIAKGSKVLIVGGGTGMILEKLPESCEQVTYVEPSAKMMKKAIQRNCKIPVKFIQEPIQECLLTQKYDTIITNFFFDMFDDSCGLEIAVMLQNLLKSNGIWILTEFENGRNWWQRTLLFTMYTFFSLTTGLRTQKLLSWREVMIKVGMEPVHTKAYFGSFISSIRYQHLNSVYSSI